MLEVNKKRDQTGSSKVILYGSKASKTSLKSDDIDILIVAPRYVDRYTRFTDRAADFFGDLYKML